ncbi:MAG: YqiA/YcfP family alpha/beta fold hydrolase [Sulfuriferula sp.]
MLIYVHGFNSSQASTKAKQIQAYFTHIGNPDAVVCPSLPHRPAQAIDLLTGLIRKHMQAHETVKLVGSSLGGFYATWLAQQFGVRAVLINPAVHAPRLLASALGDHTNYSSGEVYRFTQQHLAELAELDLPVINDPENLLLMVETGDEALDYTAAVAYYAGSRQVIVPGGNHGFSSFVQHIPTILAF